MQDLPDAPHQRFFGIVIEMYFGDHPPPHFHAHYSGESAKIEIATGQFSQDLFLAGRYGSCENGSSSIVASLRPTGSEPSTMTSQRQSSH
jgi:Domain of unknown function (DUF4160)